MLCSAKYSGVPNKRGPTMENNLPVVKIVEEVHQDIVFDYCDNLVVNE